MTGLHLSELSWRPVSRQEPTMDHLSLEIPPGQHVLLTGASGSGKSTVLRALAGLLDPEAGELTGTMPVAGRPGERALLLQQPIHALVAASIGRDVAFGLENTAARREAMARSVEAALERAAVDLDAESDPFAASGGQQQRIALAGSLALGPDVLLLDEPMSMLDVRTAEDVRTAILTAAEGRTMVVVDHDAASWTPHVDRVIVLGERSRIIQDAAPDEVELEDSTPPEPAAIQAEDPAVRIRGVRVRRRRSDETLLEDVALEARGGTLTAITGPSGAGKTSLLRVLMGLDDPASGTVLRPERHERALVPQEPEHSFVAGSVLEEVTASPWAEDREWAQELLHAADLEHLSAHNPHTLSGGEQRRLAIIAALAQRPRLLILDEPTVGLDSSRLSGILALLDLAREQGTAVVAATHDTRLISRAEQVLELPGPDAGSARPAPSRRIAPIVRRPRIPADRCNPLSLCLLGILAVIGSFAITNWQIGLASLVLVLVLAPLGVRTLRGTLLRLLPVMLSALGVAWTTALLSPEAPLSREAWLLGAKEALRIAYFVTPGLMALIAVDPTALGDALRNVLRAPARPLAAGVAAMVRLGHLRDQWERILEARIMRGLGGGRSARTLASATLALLVDMLRGAEQQSLAMDARGFAEATGRRPALPSPWGPADLLALVAAAALLLWPWSLGLLGAG